MTVLFFVLGLVFGYVSLVLGPLGLIEALIVLGIIVWQVRRFPERSGAYLVGLSVLPVVLLTIIVTQVPVCASTSATHCYAPIAIPALVAFAVAGLIGAVLLGRTLPGVLSRAAGAKEPNAEALSNRDEDKAEAAASEKTRTSRPRR